MSDLEDTMNLDCKELRQLGIEVRFISPADVERSRKEPTWDNSDQACEYADKKDQENEPSK